MTGINKRRTEITIETNSLTIIRMRGGVINAKTIYVATGGKIIKERQQNFDKSGLPSGGKRIGEL
jgi:hypothetical protein